MDISQIVMISAGVIAVHMTLYYLMAMWLRDASVIDIGWGLGFVLVAWVQYLANESPDFGHTLLTLLVTAWGLRLATHLYLRKRGKGEDWRYVKMRQKWGKGYWWKSFFAIFMLQGLIMFIISSPVTIAAMNPEFTVGVIGFIGFLAWMKGFFFESVGDFQLSQFLANPNNRGQIMQSGLWKLTRHPNYFGEITIWWGVFLIVMQLDYGLLAIVSPLMITYLLLKVSGITLLEKKYDNDPEFQDYKRRTSALIPWMPKN